ncbi:PfkB family carbohydrate kinase [Aestuariivirga litoralis]|uniref:PfkB family carbohydrate kinase n=1 Tax=Aestuariivirga litoralis TaxID=2650924 RepID=UPI0018C628EE|nr:PfkB family carbohydrate kinase [Aestuariivirga litoralis]MBG1233406.1 ribokinase [Aestuariivirga litoralis]
MAGGFDIVVVGSLHLDIVVEAQSLPMIDETARGSSWRMVCGGKGGNQACMAARLGARTAMISQVGADDFGQRLLTNLKTCGVDSSAVTTDPKIGSGMSVAILNAQGDYGAVIVSGSNLTLRQDQVSAALSKVGKFSVLVLQNEIDEAINIEAARLAKAAGAKVILNAAPARAQPAALAAFTDVLVVNRVEAAMMSGLEVNDAASTIKALSKLKALGREIVITLGGDGLVVAPAQGDPVIIAPIPIQVASTHGAGDCFIGQLALALAQKQNLIEAARAANQTAAAYVSGKLVMGPQGNG